MEPSRLGLLLLGLVQLSLAAPAQKSEVVQVLEGLEEIDLRKADQDGFEVR